MTDKKTTRKRRTLAERKAAMLAELAKLEARERAEELASDPRLEGINAVYSRLEGIATRARSTVNGRGRGHGAAARIEALTAEIEDLRVRLERDTKVLLHVDATLEAVGNHRDAIVAGEADSSDPLPEFPECLRYDTYSLTEQERKREAELKAAREQREANGQPEPVSEGETQSEENEAVADFVGGA
jgi:hypothetical protein